MKVEIAARQYASYDEAAKAWGVSRVTIRNWVNRGRAKKLY